MGIFSSYEKQADSEHFTELTFQLNILICGNYNTDIFKSYLDIIENKSNNQKGNYIKYGKHKNMKDWQYYFFPTNEIEKNTYDFIENQMILNNKKNLILFYSGKDYNPQKLLEFYDEKGEIYHPQFIIITESNKTFEYQNIKKINPKFINIIPIDKNFELLIKILKICSYYNELGDEVGFPKMIIQKEIINIDSKLMSKYLFTINCVVCGRPGAGKSLFINKILRENKCLSLESEEDSLTSKIVKYIHSELPITLYDTPGFNNDKQIDKVEQLILDKNKNLKEQKNKIHFIFYLMNKHSSRGFSPREITFIRRLLEEKMNIYFVITHAENKSNSEDYKATVQLSLKKNKLTEKIENIFQIELKNQVFGLKELFNDLFQKYQSEKINSTIDSTNLQNIKSFFLKDIKSEEDIIGHATALSNRIINNFSLLSSSLGKGPNVKGTTMLSCAVIKIISKIYDKDITDNECLMIINMNGYKNEIENTEEIKTNCFLSFFNPNPAAKEIYILGKKQIKLYNKTLHNNKEKLYKYINKICQSINEAIDNLDKIKD